MSEAQFVRLSEVQNKLSISRQQVHKLIADGRLKAIVISPNPGKAKRVHYRVLRADLNRLMNGQV